ncbi:hypothetical protein [Spongiactinospora sp. 9N601]|uniref:hypothetical protein n=1 Tax=Spongiactinospora sp. 9N601 TaxID=3375149 RepID=UPI00379A8EFE
MTMQAPEVSRAVAAAMAVVSSLGLAADDAVVLHDSNRLTLRLLIFLKKRVLACENAGRSRFWGVRPSVTVSSRMP